MPILKLRMPVIVEAIILTPLGHGRMIETYLATVCGVYGLILLIPESAQQSQATRGDWFDDYGQFLAVPFLIKAGLSITGVISNVRGWPHEFWFRFLGGMLGIMLFTWYAAKFALRGAYATVGFPFCIVSTFMCFRVLVMSLFGLPIPGAPGRM